MKKLFPGTLWVAATILLLLVSGRAADKDHIEGLVVPDNISNQQPFSFSVPQSKGAEVDIQTVSGEVVQQATTDKYGRIFLAAGLPAGAYLISLGSHHQPIGKLEIKPPATENLQHVPQSIQIQNPGAVKLSNPFSLTGHGFNPNCSNMQVSLAGSGKTETPLVLAATEDQLKLAPVQQLQPGMTQLKVTNEATGQSTEPQQFLLYSISGELGRNTIKSGHDETQLTLRVQPVNMALKVKVDVVSGPVDFGQGSKEVEGITSNGQAVFPVHAEHGAGEFQLAWEVVLPSQEDADDLSDEEAAALLGQIDSATWKEMIGTFNDVQARNTVLAETKIPDSIRKKILKWWLDYLEAMCAYEMLDGWITSPFHYPLDEGDVRAQVRTQITALTDGAKKKLIKRLKDRAKALRDKAKNLKDQGKAGDAQRAEDQAKAFDQAADEVEKSLSPGAKP